MTANVDVGLISFQPPATRHKWKFGNEDLVVWTVWRNFLLRVLFLDTLISESSALFTKEDLATFNAHIIG